MRKLTVVTLFLMALIGVAKAPAPSPEGPVPYCPPFCDNGGGNK